MKYKQYLNEDEFAELEKNKKKTNAALYKTVMSVGLGFIVLIVVYFLLKSVGISVICAIMTIYFMLLYTQMADMKRKITLIQLIDMDRTEQEGKQDERKDIGKETKPSNRLRDASGRDAKVRRLFEDLQPTGKKPNNIPMVGKAQTDGPAKKDK